MPHSDNPPPSEPSEPFEPFEPFYTTLLHNPFPQPFYTTCGEAAPPLVAGATTFLPLCCRTMGAGQGCQFACGAATERNRTTGPVARWKCTPFGANAPPFPRWGNSSLRFPRIFPSGGDAAAGGRRGAFPSRRRRGLPVFPRPPGRLPDFIKRGAFLA